MPKMFATTSGSSGIEPGISVLVTERYYLLTRDPATVNSSIHRQTGIGTRAGYQWNHLQRKQDLQQLVHNEKTWCYDDQMRKHIGNFRKST